MQHIIVVGKYSKAGHAGMLAKPENREETLRPFIEKAGGRLLSFYATTGEFDFHIVLAAPDMETVTAIMAVTNASAGITDLRLSLAFTGAEAKAAHARGQSLTADFRSAGA